MLLVLAMNVRYLQEVLIVIIGALNVKAMLFYNSYASNTASKTVELANVFMRKALLAFNNNRESIFQSAIDLEEYNHISKVVKFHYS